MVKTIRVSEEFHGLVAAHKHESETMEEALYRMVYGPSPEIFERALAGDDEDAAAELREIVEHGRERSRDRAAELRHRPATVLYPREPTARRFSTPADNDHPLMRRFSADYLRRTRDGMWADEREALADLELPACDRILDVGCGEGALTRVLREECPGEVVGCDRDAALLAELDGPTVRGDVYHLPFRDDAVDLVVCQALLVNLPEPRRAVREIARVASDRVACVEPDNGRVSVRSTVEAEPGLAARARDRYLEGADTDVALGDDAAGLLRAAGLSNVRTTRYDRTLVVEPPYSKSEVQAVGRKAYADGLRTRRATMAGTEEELDALRSEWRSMGREAARQLRAGDYRREETVPFYATVGEV